MSRVFEALKLIPSSARLAPLPLAGTELCCSSVSMCRLGSSAPAPRAGDEGAGRGSGEAGNSGWGWLQRHGDFPASLALQ